MPRSVVRDVLHLKSEYFDERIFISLGGVQESAVKRSPKKAEGLDWQRLYHEKETECKAHAEHANRMEEEVYQANEELSHLRATLEEKNSLEHEFAKLQEENAELRAQLDAGKSGDEYLTQVKKLLGDKAPSLERLVELSLRQEREHTERKHAKILEILQIKDSQIEDLQGRVEQSQKANSALQHKLEDNKVLLNNAERSLALAQKTAEELKTQNYDQLKEIEKLRQELDNALHADTPTASFGPSFEDSERLKQLHESSKREVETLRKGTEELTQALSKASEELKRLKAREQYVMELSGRQEVSTKHHELLSREKDQIITELKAKVTTQAEHITSLLGQFTQASTSELMSRMIRLEEENRELMAQMPRSRGGTSAGSLRAEELGSLSSAMEAQVHRIHELEAENRELSDSIAKIEHQSKAKLERSLADKNSALEQMEQKLLEVKRLLTLQTGGADLELARELAELSTSLNTQQQRAARLEQENAGLKETVSQLELQNSSLSREFSSLAQKVDTGDLSSQQIATQTQIVSRLNARVSSLKAREEQALTAAALAEEHVLKLQAQLDDERRTKKAEGSKTATKSPMKQVRLKVDAYTEAEDEGWRPDSDSFDLRRYERKLAELTKETTMYQLKHYEALKETHEVKERFTRKMASQLDEISSLQREVLQLQKKAELLEDQLHAEKLEAHKARMQGAEEKERREALHGEVEAARRETVKQTELARRDVEVLRQEKQQAEEVIKERTSQLAVLMETMESSAEGEDSFQQRLIDLTAQLCASKAVEGALKKKLLVLQSQLTSAQKRVQVMFNDLTRAESKTEDLNGALASLRIERDAVRKQLQDLQQVVVAKDYDLRYSRSQVEKLQGDEQAYKHKLSAYVQQLSDSQRRHAQVLSKERQEFRESLVRMQQEPPVLPDYERPLIVALNQLKLNLANLRQAVHEPEIFERLVSLLQGAVIECDRTMLSCHSKLRTLEFQLRSEVVFKYLDEFNIEKSNQLLDQVELLSSELKLMHKTAGRGTEAVLKQQVSDLGATLEAKDRQLTDMELKHLQINRRLESAQVKEQRITDKLRLMEAERDLFIGEAQQRAEEALKSRFASRDEEIKAYVDGQLTRVAVESTEASKILALGREISALKLLLEDFQTQHDSMTTAYDTLHSAYTNLKLILEQPAEVAPVDLDEKAYTEDLREELRDAQKAVFKLKEQSEELTQKNSLLSKQLNDCEIELRSKAQAEPLALDSSLAEQMRRELLELKEHHKVELEALRTEHGLEQQRHQEELEQKYVERSQKFRDGAFPGDFKQQNTELRHEIAELLNARTALEDELARAEARCSGLISQLRQQKDELEAQRQAYSEIVVTLEQQPSAPTRQPAPPQKKGAKVLTLEKPTVQAIKPPKRLVKSLIDSKLAEAEACKKLRQAGRTQIDLREALARKDEQLRVQEARLRGYQRLLKQFDLADNLSVLESSDSDFTVKRRLLELEAENAELRIAEAYSWKDRHPISLHFGEFESGDSGSQDFAMLLEGVVYLTEQICENESFASYTSEGRRNVDIESCQRLVIRALSRALSKSLKGEETLQSIIDYRPTREEDRQLWYVELLETQLTSVHRTISDLIRYRNQLEVEISGNLVGSAQYKGASMELAKCTKETADEVTQLLHTCDLIKADLLEIKGTEQDLTDQTYKDRARLAETLRKKMEEELVQLKLKHSYEVTELHSQVRAFEGQLERLQGQEEHFSTQKSSITAEINDLRRKVTQLNEQLGNTQAEKQRVISEVEQLKAQTQTTQVRSEKAKKEVKEVKEDAKRTLSTKDMQLAEMTGKVATLTEEKKQLQQEMLLLKRQSRGRTEDPKQRAQLEDEVASLQIKIKALVEDRRIEEERLRRDKDLAERKAAELESYLQLLKAQLEDKEHQLHHAKKRSKSVGRPPKQEKARGDDAELEEHTKNVEILTIRNEYEGQLRILKNNLAEVHSSLRQKIELADDEVRRRIEAEKSLRKLQDTRQEVEDRLKESLAEANQHAIYSEAELRAAREELRKLREERDSVNKRLEERVDKAEYLATFIQQAESDKRQIEAQYREELQKLQASSQKKTSQLMDQVQSLQAKNSALEEDNHSLNSRLQELEENWGKHKHKVTEYTGIKRRLKETTLSFQEEIKGLVSEKEAIQREAGAKLEEIYALQSTQFEEYERTVELYEHQLSKLKEFIAQDMKPRKGVKKSGESVDLWMQISRKDAQLKAMQTELKKLKAKKPKGQTSPNEQEILHLAKVSKLTGTVRNLEAQLQVERDEVDRLSREIEDAAQPTEEVKDNPSRKEIIDIERRHRSEMQRLSEEAQRIRDRWHSPEEWSQLQAAKSELELALRRSNEEVSRKRELLDNYKALRDQQENEATQLHDEIEQIKDISDKLKVMRAELSRKERTLAEVKQAFDIARDNERKVTEENAGLNDRLKRLTGELARKDNVIRDFKSRLESVGFEAEGQKNSSEQLDKTKEQVRRLKAEIDRKDAQLRSFKAKVETLEVELQSAQHEVSHAANENFTTLEKELKKNESLRYKLKSTEGQLQSLYLITRRIFRELSSQVESMKRKGKQPLEREYLSDCMNILNMSMDELSEFVQPRPTDSAGSLDRLERLLNDKEVDPMQVLEIYNRLMEERLELERSSGRR
jgi:chromosome segregation ATPase